MNFKDTKEDTITIMICRSTNVLKQDLIKDIKEDTITIAVDILGGMCDRLMLGTKGIINNANACIECWKFNAPTDEDLQELKAPQDLERALEILFTDNFHVELVNNIEQVRELLQDNEVEIDLNNVEFNKDGLYSIY